MRTYALVVHNSDEVKAVFVGDSIEGIIKMIMATTYGGDIEKRSLEYYNEGKREDAEEEGKGWVDVDEIPIKDIDFDMINRLYHDGDSEDGYTWLLTDIGGDVKWFKDAW